MNFAVKNAFRNKLRTFFIIILLVMGVLAIIASMALSQVSTEILGGALSSGGGNFEVKDSKSNSLTINDLNNIKNIKGVQEAVGISSYMITIGAEDNYKFKGFYGKNLADNIDIPGMGHIKLINGNLGNNSPNEIILTKESAEKMSKKMGDLLTITKVIPIGIITAIELSEAENMGKEINMTFKVVGIIDSLPNRSYGILSMKGMDNALYCSSELKFDSINFKVNKNEIKGFERQLGEIYPQYVVLESGNVLDELRDIFFYITSFFICIGAFIMMITTSKSISERTREIGVLKAIGWSNKRVVTLILTESFVQLLVAWIITIIIICFLVLSFQTELDTVDLIKNHMVSAAYILVYSLIVSLLIPLIGCLIPLLRVVRLKPTEALKYE